MRSRPITRRAASGPQNEKCQSAWLRTISSHGPTPGSGALIRTNSSRGRDVGLQRRSQLCYRCRGLQDRQDTQGDIAYATDTGWQLGKVPFATAKSEIRATKREGAQQLIESSMAKFITLLIAAAIVSLGVPARAQNSTQDIVQDMPGLGKNQRGPQKRAEPKKKVDEKEYDAALKSIPDAPKKVDPWGKLR